MPIKRIVADPPLSEEEIAELVEHYGSVDAILEKLRRFGQASSLLNEAWPALMEKYPDKWVSMDADGKLTVADSLEDLVAAHAARGIHSGSLPWKFLDTSPTSLVL